MPDIPPQQPNNPSFQDRLNLFYYGLDQLNRPEDFHNILERLSPPIEITSIVPAGSCKNIKVAVLGGGLAGLSAAFELRKLGFQITLYEAEEKRIGGRVFTHYFLGNCQNYGELGPIRFPVGHQTTWHYIDLFRLNTRPYIVFNENTFRYAREVRSRNTPEEIERNFYPIFNLTPEEMQTPWPDLQNKVLETYLQGIPPEIRKELLDIREDYSPQINELDYFSLHQAMQRVGLSDGAIEMITALDPFAAGFIDVSHLDILQNIYPANFTYMYEMVGGLSQLPQAFLRSLANPIPLEYGPLLPKEVLGNVDIKLGHQITGLSQREPRGSVTVHYKTKQDLIGGEEIFDFVVCCLPFSNVRLIELNPQFSSKKMQAIKSINLLSGQKTVFLCNRRFWEEGFPDERIIGGVSSTDLVINSILYPSVPALSPFEGGVITASYNYTQDAIRLGNFLEEDIPEIIKRQIEEVHGLPRCSLDEIVVDYKTLHWNNHPWALGAFTFYTPKENRLFSKVSIEPEYSNRVFFAGEHVSVSRGWMQGALQTGMLAANGIALACRQYL